MKKLFITALFLILIPFLLISQEVDREKAPSWLLMELGQKAFREKNFGEALVLFREVKKREGTSPEADMWIGLVFEADAETELAIKQLEMAYEQKNQLYILEEEYTILYKLAELYRRQGENLLYEERLKNIIADDSDYASVKMEVLVRVLQEKGLEDLLKLYRFTSDFSIEAHMALGSFYHESGRIPQSVNHLLFAIITLFSHSIDFLRKEDPEYAFEGTSEFFLRAGQYRELERYFQSSNLFPGIYILATALKETRHIAIARSLMRIVTDQTKDPILRNRGIKDLKEWI